MTVFIVSLFPFRTYEVYIPKFSIKTSYSLKEVLEEMGMTDMFGDRANLTGIAEGQKLAVSEVGIKYVMAQKISPNLVFTDVFTIVL